MALLVAGGAVARQSSSAKVQKQAAAVKVTTRSVTGLGKVLVNSRGFTLYMFVPDKRAKVTCVKSCAVAWPPLKAGTSFVVAGGVKKSLLSSDRNPAGGRVVTYNKWPLYTYVADRKPGQAKGQAINANGGLWYVMNAAGTVIKKKPGSSGGGSGSSCTDRDFDGDGSSGGPDDGDGCL
ncbi:MAG TPA: hypothetical protein VGU02_05005 [Gaiellaceae bacterium]|nr:hypothetical protein [Gaiellaceae bacterium]